MKFNSIPNMSPQTLAQLDAISKQREKLINAATIQEGCTASQIAKNLYDEIIRYQLELRDTEDVAIMLVQFGQAYTIRVSSVGCSGYSLVCFHGVDNNGKHLELIQHISQLNFLLQAVPKDIPDTPKRKIGFFCNSVD